MKRTMGNIQAKAALLHGSAMAKLKEERGNGEMTGMLVLVVIVVVIGAILLVAFREQIDGILDQVGEKITDMFNYT